MTAESDPARRGHERRPSPLPSDLAASLALAGVVAMSATLASPAPAGLIPGFLALAVLLVARRWPLRRGLRLAWRLRWFLLSLLVFFGWLSNEGGATGWERVIPSHDGLGDAALRGASLLLVVFWVTWLTSIFDRDAQIQGLNRWLMLLRPLGVRGDVFARRMFLALDYFEAREGEYRAFRQRAGGSRWRGLKAGREFLIDRLDQALAMDALSSEVSGGIATRASEGTATGVVWQVFLLWLAVLATLWLRSVLPAAGV